jgi:predicted N-acetyltransferase YhbS
LKFAYLVENQEYIPLVATWIYKEFVENSKPNISLENVIQKLHGHKKQELPITIIAKEGDQCIGTVSLFENDFKGMEIKPWLASLVVDKQYRGTGIGKALIREITKIAISLDYTILYLRTEHATEYYKKLGWLFIEKRIDECGIQAEIFSKKINPRHVTDKG